MPETGAVATVAERFDGARVAEAWQRFVAGEAFDASVVREPILASWQRCRSLGVDAARVRPPSIGDAARVEALLQAHRELLAAAAHTWALLSPTLGASDVVFVVADARGIVLDVRGNPALVAAAATRGTAPGYDWSEAASGTNALGTGAVLGRPIIVHSGEHYCAAGKTWDCAAAPVRDLSDGTLLGFVDITSMGGLSDHHSLALAVTAAHQVEHTLHAQELARTVRLLQWYRTPDMPWQHRPSLLLDRKGRVITGNDTAHAICDALPARFALVDGRPVAPDDGSTILMATAPYRASGEPAPADPSAWSGGVVTIAVDDTRAVSAAGGTPRTARRFHPAFHAIATQDAGLLELMGRAERMARANSPVLLHGETGTGKELFARAIHLCSAVSAGPFVAVNCGTLTKELAASELLGYEAGAFTGASAKGRVGKFELADGGSLFLDEIGELPLDVQVQLLRVLQDRIVVRLGGNVERTVRVRIVAASHRDLEQEIDAGRFRADLYFRLKVFTLRLPSLRERRDDIGLLVERFLQQLQGVYGLGAKTASAELVDALTQHDWPGNVRELLGLVESLYILSEGPVLGVRDLPEEFRHRRREAGVVTIAAANMRGADERAAILAAIAEDGSNLSRAARRLGMSRSTLYRKLAHYGIDGRGGV
ncbi:MAG: sigma-54-dependent Fis family transcriptional regulator [Gammaproteobacteria bacterium]